MKHESIESVFRAAIRKYGEEKAMLAAEESVSAWNVNAIAGASPEECAREQIAAFLLALDD